MSELYDVVKKEIDALIAEAKADVADKQLSLSEIWAFAQHVVASFVNVAGTLNADGADKKAVVLAAADKFYDEVIAPIDIPAIPNIIEPAFDKFGKSLFLQLVSGAIDFIVDFNKGK